MPDPSHVGRKYSAPGQVIEADRAQKMAQAIAGADEVAEPGSIPPTLAAVYCLAPTMAQLFTDPDVGINLAGLIHGEQSFEWPEPVRAGDVVDSEAEITSVAQRRGMTFVGLHFQATRQSDRAVVCEGRALMIVRGG